ncbi:hypothetical protein ACVW1A_000003 [Bradyrhizobium sp. LB1.3]
MFRNLRTAVAIGMLVGVAAPAYAQGSSWESVVADAKKEGKVVVYSMALGAPYYLAVLRSRTGPGCLDSAARNLSGFLPVYAERGALRFCRCVGGA